MKGVLIYPYIESKDNNHIKHVVKLATDARFRKESGLAVAYGYHLVEEAARHQLIEKLFIREDKLALFDKIIIDNNLANKVVIVSTKIINRFNILDSDIDYLATILIKQTELSISNNEMA